MIVKSRYSEFDTRSLSKESDLHERRLGEEDYQTETPVKNKEMLHSLDFKNGPPFLSFGGFQKRVAIFFLVFCSLLERGTRDKNKNAIFVFVFVFVFDVLLERP